jgi:hypothetical protein
MSGVVLMQRIRAVKRLMFMLLSMENVGEMLSLPGVVPVPHYSFL